MATIIEAIAVFEATCVRRSVTVRAVVIEKQQNYLEVFKSALIPWRQFTKLSNCDAAANFAEPTLFHLLQEHLANPCECDGSILFKTSGGELCSSKNNMRIYIPENLNLVPCNSPNTECSGRTLPLEVQVCGGEGEGSAVRSKFSEALGIPRVLQRKRKLEID